jgi:hypothetical protein
LLNTAQTGNLVADLGADVDGVSKKSSVPLHCIAAHKGPVAVVRYLLKESGANVNSLTKDGCTRDCRWRLMMVTWKWRGAWPRTLEPTSIKETTTVARLYTLQLSRDT